MGSQQDWQAELDAALFAADGADKIIRRYYGGDFDVTLKQDQSPVTVADVESEESIRARLSEAFPGYGFYGEETGQSDMDADRYWLVDPIDGTKSFVRRYPFFSTQIALRSEEGLVLGVSNAPAFNERAWAVRGQGAWLDGAKIGVSTVASVRDATLSTGNLGSAARDERWAKLGSLVADVNRIRGYGDFYHYHLLARGAIDAVVESDVNILDIAALSVIVEAAGGRFTDWSGNSPGLETTTVVATNGALHDELIERLN